MDIAELEQMNQVAEEQLKKTNEVGKQIQEYKTHDFQNGFEFADWLNEQEDKLDDEDRYSHISFLKSLISTKKEHEQLSILPALSYEYRSYVSLTKKGEVKPYSPLLVADIIKRHFYIVKLGITNDNSIAIYLPFGRYEGTYTQDKNIIYSIIAMIEPALEEKDAKAVIFHLKNDINIKTVEPNEDNNYIACNNGIYDKQNDKLLPFNHRFIFTSKIATNYNEHATISPNIDGWNVDDFINDLANNDHEIKKLLWQVIASVATNKRTNKAFFLYSEKAGTGKGTYQALLENLVGKYNYANLKIDEFSKDFRISNLLGKSLCIGDDINGDIKIKDNSTFNSIVTHDPVLIEFKYQQPFSTTLNINIIQSCNGVPKFANIAGAERRMCIIPFNNQFVTKDDPNKANDLIKTDYVARQDVLEYVLYKAVHLKFDKLIEPKAVIKAKDEYMKNANSIYSFKAEFWDAINKDNHINKFPTTYLYDWYKAFCKYNNFAPFSKHNFSIKFINIIDKYYKHSKQRLSTADINQLREIKEKINGFSCSTLTGYQSGKPYNIFIKK